MSNLIDLEEKINNLEKILITTQNSKISPPLLEKLDFVEKKLEEYKVKPQISFLQKSSLNKKIIFLYSLARDFTKISERLEKDPTFYLSNRDKLKLMLSSNNMLENIQTDLNDMNNLKQHLEFDPFIEVKEKNEIIAGLIIELRKNGDQFESQNAETMEFLKSNENIITQINKKLLYLESIISVLEKENSRNKTKKN